MEQPAREDLRREHGLLWLARKKGIGIIGNGMIGKATKQEKQQKSKNDRSILENDTLSYTK